MMIPHYQFDAFQAVETLRERMADYLLEAFRVRDPALGERLRHNWTLSGAKVERLFAPMLVQGAFPFRPGLTLEELRSPSRDEQDPERPLHPRTVRLLQGAGMTYRLYQHQVEAIRAATRGQTMVLSAGTGSGKTESFLIPLIDRLMWSHERGEDDLEQPGIRALVIYPLNALVNNQIERILKLLRGQTQIRFAYYTSRLKDSRTGAENYYRNKLKREVPPECQILDRKSLRGIGKPGQSWQGPPHILVTNFSMLEYMLIRLLDRSIFGEHSLFFQGQPRLRALVLDEAHVYGGTQADEIHMLLRRAAQRFGTSLEALQGYATSATLSTSDDENGTTVLSRFAADMFAKEEDEVAVVIGKRHLPAAQSSAPVRTDLETLRAPAELPVSVPLVPADLQTMEFDDEGEPAGLLQGADMARKAAQACVTLGLAGEGEIEALVTAAEGYPAKLIHAVVARHPRLMGLRAWLFDGIGEDGASHETRYFDEVVSLLYGMAEEAIDEAARRATHALLQLSSLARAEEGAHPFIPARMHLFVRAPAGAWVKPKAEPGQRSGAWPWGQITSHPQVRSDEDPWLRLYLCSECGHPFLQAWQREQTFTLQAALGQTMVALSADTEATTRMPEAWGGHGVQVTPMAIQHEGAREQVRLTKNCPHCRSKDVRLEGLRLSPRGALPALIDAVYPSLGELPAGIGAAFRPGGGRRLLTFSDSRQGAARVAAEVESSHDTGVNRQILWRILREEGGPMAYEDLLERLVEDTSPDLLMERAESSALLDADEDLRDKMREELADVAIHEELSSPPARGNTLETMGLVEVCYPKLPDVPRELAGKMDKSAWHGLLATVLDDARRRGAVKRPSIKHEESWQELLPRNGLKRFLTRSSGAPDDDEQDGERERGDDARIPLIPAQHSERSRMVDFARRLCERGALGMKSEEVLSLVWNALVQAATDKRCKWLKVTRDGATELVQIHMKGLKLEAHQNGPRFIEPETGRVYFRSVLGVSPEKGSSYQLRELTEEERAQWRQRHGVRRVTEHELLGLWSVEHTAQLDADALEAQEKAFKSGHRNMLASSTTMEMGVDLGGLTFVMLTNVPPGPANYWQRAGRAGRRADGSSMVLTLAQSRPHDQLVFVNPRDFLERPMTPPQVRLDTSPLLLRHVNAFLLTEFYQRVVVAQPKGNPMRSFGNVNEFILQTVSELKQEAKGGVSPELVEAMNVSDQETLSEIFGRWLQGVHADETLRGKLASLVARTELELWPLTALTEECAIMYERAAEQARADLDVVEAQRQAEEDRGEGAADTKFLGLLKHQERRLRKESLISYLARNDVLPRFGFPIDVVRLDTTWKLSDLDNDDDKDKGDVKEEREQALRMERALALALGEYAPGGEVIAGKRVYRVAGLEKNWMLEEQGMARLRHYSECVRCSYVTFDDYQITECKLCRNPVKGEEEFIRGRLAAEAQKKKRDARDDERADDETAEGLVSPVRSYLEPSNFAVKFGRPPRRVAGRIRRMPSPRISIGPSREQPAEVLDGLLAMGFTPESPLFIRSEGALASGRQRSARIDQIGYGYRICQWCGLVEPEVSWGKHPPPGYGKHWLLRGLKKCPHPDSQWPHAVLGVQQQVDAYRVRLLGEMAPQADNKTQARSFYLSLAVCLQQVAARMLQVDSRTLQAAVATYRQEGDVPGYEAVIYDTSGSGMLAHLDENPLELVRQLLEMLAQQNEADFIQFDTQHLVESGELNIPLLRAHFVEDAGRQALLTGASPILEQQGARILRGQSPRIAARRLIDDARNELSMQTAAFEETAFEQGGMLRALLARALEHGHEGGRMRLLLGQVPAASSNTEELFLADRLAQLVEHGVEVRRAPAADVDALGAAYWNILARSARGQRLLGGMAAAGGSAGPAFGQKWLHDCVPLENRSQADARRAWEDFEEIWSRAAVVASEELRPPAEGKRQWILTIAGDDTSPESTELETILQQRTGLGPLAALGQVERLHYNDRYVIRSALAMWRLNKLLAMFVYAPGATGTVVCRAATKKGGVDEGSVADVLNKSVPPNNLSTGMSGKFVNWSRAENRERGLQLDFAIAVEGREDANHQRKLVVQLAPGSAFSQVEMFFEHGLDWARPTGGGDSRPWPQQPMRAEASHIVVLLDP